MVIRFGLVSVGEIGSGLGSLHVSWLLWAYAENFMKIHQDLAKL